MFNKLKLLKTYENKENINSNYSTISIIIFYNSLKNNKSNNHIKYFYINLCFVYYCF